MVSRFAWQIVLIVILAGCGHQVGTGELDLAAICLEKHPGDVRCCFPGDHVDHGTCCPAGSHEVSDVENADWRICVWDSEAGADAALDAGIDAP